MRKYLFAVLASAIMLHASALIADESIGVLESRLQSSRVDTVKIELLLQMGDYFEFTDYDSALHFYEQALSISRQSIESASQPKYLEKLKTLEAKSLRYIAILNEGWSKYDKALQQHQELNELYRQQNDYNGIVNSMIRMGNIHYYTGEAALALDYYQQALELADSNQYHNLMANIRTNIANLYYTWGDYTTSLDIFHEALRLYSTINDNRNKGITYSGIGNIHNSLKNYEKAESFYRQALNLFDELEDHHNIASTLLSLGVLYYSQDLYDKAEEYYGKALYHATVINDMRQEAQSLLNLGVLSASRGDYRKAIEIYQEALVAARKTKNKHIESYILRNKAYSFLHLKNFGEAMRLANQSLALAKELGYLEDQADSYKALSEIRQQQGNYKQALLDFQQYKLLNDSLLDRAKKKELNELDARFQSEQKQQMIDMQNLELERNQAELGRKNQLVNTFIIIMIFIVLLAIAIVLYFNQKKNTNIVISKQKQTIEEKIDHIETLNQQLAHQKEVVKEKEMLYLQLDLKLKNQLKLAHSISENINHFVTSTDNQRGISFFSLPTANGHNHRDLFSVISYNDLYLFSFATLKTDEHNKTLLNIAMSCYLHRTTDKEKIKNPEACFTDLQQHIGKQLTSLENEEERESFKLAMLMIDKKTHRVRFISEELELLLAISRNSESIFRPIYDYHELQKPEPSGIINEANHPRPTIAQVYNIKLKETDRIYLINPGLRLTNLVEAENSLYTQILGFIDNHQNVDLTLQVEYINAELAKTAGNNKQNLPDDFVLRAMEL
ncbi:MAG: tetratricopeptide repeat protein [Bacteroidota bacterium]